MLNLTMISNFKEKCDDLDGESGRLAVIIGNDNIIGQNDDVVLDFFGNAFGTRGR